MRNQVERVKAVALGNRDSKGRAFYDHASSKPSDDDCDNESVLARLPGAETGTRGSHGDPLN